MSLNGNKHSNDHVIRKDGHLRDVAFPRQVNFLMGNYISNKGLGIPIHIAEKMGNKRYPIEFLNPATGRPETRYVNPFADLHSLADGVNILNQMNLASEDSITRLTHSIQVLQRAYDAAATTMPNIPAILPATPELETPTPATPTPATPTTPTPTPNLEIPSPETPQDSFLNDWAREYDSRESSNYATPSHTPSGPSPPPVSPETISEALLAVRKTDLPSSVMMAHSRFVPFYALTPELITSLQIEFLQSKPREKTHFVVPNPDGSYKRISVSRLHDFVFFNKDKNYMLDTESPTPIIVGGPNLQSKQEQTGAYSQPPVRQPVPIFKDEPPAKQSTSKQSTSEPSAASMPPPPPTNVRNLINAFEHSEGPPSKRAVGRPAYTSRKSVYNVHHK